MRMETLAVHAGLKVDAATGAVVPPIHAATTFEHEPDSTYPRGFLYSRSGNPNRNALEECVCDNTATTSALQRPLALGADLVVYATTKYLGGHCDVMGGAVVAARRDAFFERVRTIQTAGGAIPSPFDCWLVRRGIRTLPWR